MRLAPLCRLALPPDAIAVMCGPMRMLEAARRAWNDAGRAPADLRYETFGSSGLLPTTEFRVRLKDSDAELVVSPNSSMLDVLNASSGRNSATQDKIPKHVLNRRFDFGFANALSFKDVRLCLDEAEALGVPMVVGAAVRQMLSITHQIHGAAADCTDLVRVVENWAGCQIGSKEE